LTKLIKGLIMVVFICMNNHLIIMIVIGLCQVLKNKVSIESKRQELIWVSRLKEISLNFIKATKHIKTYREIMRDKIS
jgi:hypothetical protein